MAANATAAYAKVSESADASAADTSAASEESASAFGGPWTKAAAVVAAAGVATVKMASDFQSSMTLLVTGAGQAKSSLSEVSNGILSMAGQVAQTPKELAAGMYMIESAGYHGAAGLDILKASAEGAAVGGADMSDVANVVTSDLNAYGLQAKDATSVTDQLVATVAAGKMHMQDLSTALARVLPIAASSKIAYSQVGGALATMTAQGVTARMAATNLANMIRNIVAPGAAASAEMKTLGLNANELSSNVGKVGLTGTLDQMTAAILRNTQGGSVLASGFQNMTPPARALAEQILNNSISSKALTTAMGGLSPVQAKLVSEFDASATSATGLKQTFDDAMKTMAGGATGLNVALELSGSHSKTFAANVQSVADAARKGGTSVTGFADTQKDLKFEMDAAADAAEADAIRVGSVLIPVLEDVAQVAVVVAEHVGGILKTSFDVLRDTVMDIAGPIEAVIGWFDRASKPALALAAALGVVLAPTFVTLAATGVSALASLAASFVSDFATMAAQAAVWAAAMVANMARAVAAGASYVASNAANAVSVVSHSSALARPPRSLQPLCRPLAPMLRRRWRSMPRSPTRRERRQAQAWTRLLGRSGWCSSPPLWL